MIMFKSVQALLLGGMLISIMGCGGTDIQSSEKGAFIQNIIGQELELAKYSSNKLWEGEIEGKQISYFRSKTQNSFNNIVVVTQDGLPDHFRSIEYYDNDGDKNLDLINIKRYREGEGWNDVKITAKNANTLRHANTKYNKLLNKIKDLRLDELEF
jgi:hypothetical protein